MDILVSIFQHIKRLFDLLLHLLSACLILLSCLTGIVLCWLLVGIAHIDFTRLSVGNRIVGLLPSYFKSIDTVTIKGLLMSPRGGINIACTNVQIRSADGSVEAEIPIIDFDIPLLHMGHHVAYPVLGSMQDAKIKVSLTSQDITLTQVREYIHDTYHIIFLIINILCEEQWIADNQADSVISNIAINMYYDDQYLDSIIVSKISGTRILSSAGIRSLVKVKARIKEEFLDATMMCHKHNLWSQKLTCSVKADAVDVATVLNLIPFLRYREFFAIDSKANVMMRLNIHTGDRRLEEASYDISGIDVALSYKDSSLAPVSIDSYKIQGALNIKAIKFTFNNILLKSADLGSLTLSDSAVSLEQFHDNDLSWKTIFNFRYINSDNTNLLSALTQLFRDMKPWWYDTLLLKIHSFDFLKIAGYWSFRRKNGVPDIDYQIDSNAFALTTLDATTNQNASLLRNMDLKIAISPNLVSLRCDSQNSGGTIDINHHIIQDESGESVLRLQLDGSQASSAFYLYFINGLLPADWGSSIIKGGLNVDSHAVLSVDLNIARTTNKISLNKIDMTLYDVKHKYVLTGRRGINVLLQRRRNLLYGKLDLRDAKVLDPSANVLKDVDGIAVISTISAQIDDTLWQHEVKINYNKSNIFDAVFRAHLSMDFLRDMVSAKIARSTGLGSNFTLDLNKNADSSYALQIDGDVIHLQPILSLYPRPVYKNKDDSKNFIQQLASIFRGWEKLHIKSKILLKQIYLSPSKTISNYRSSIVVDAGHIKTMKAYGVINSGTGNKHYLHFDTIKDNNDVILLKGIVTDVGFIKSIIDAATNDYVLLPESGLLAISLQQKKDRNMKAQIAMKDMMITAELYNTRSIRKTKVLRRYENIDFSLESDYPNATLELSDGKLRSSRLKMSLAGTMYLNDGDIDLHGSVMHESFVNDMLEKFSWLSVIPRRADTTSGVTGFQFTWRGNVNRGIEETIDQLLGTSSVMNVIMILVGISMMFVVFG